MDSRAMQARELHRRAAENERLAGAARHQRDELIRELYASGSYSYTTLAAAVGCGRELVKAVIKRRVGPGTRGRRVVRDRG